MNSAIKEDQQDLKTVNPLREGEATVTESVSRYPQSKSSETSERQQSTSMYIKGFYKDATYDAEQHLRNVQKMIKQGNAQIFQSMLYKDVDREKILNDLVKMIFAGWDQLPVELQRDERAKMEKFGPKSRYSEEKLYATFEAYLNEPDLSKIDEQAFEAAIEALRSITQPGVAGTLVPLHISHSMVEVYNRALINGSDSTVSYPYYVKRNDKRKFKGMDIKTLMIQDATKIDQDPRLALEDPDTEYYRVQQGGNDKIEFDGPKGYTFLDGGQNGWRADKNRFVFGSSGRVALWGQSYVYALYDLWQQVKPANANMALWWDSVNRDKTITNMIDYQTEHKDELICSSTDISGYDTNMHDRIITAIWDRVIIPLFKPEYKEKLDYLRDSFREADVITTRGVKRVKHSIRSGHAFTNMFGSLANMFGALYVQQRLFVKGMTKYDALSWASYQKEAGIPFIIALGDDLFQLIVRGATPDVLEEIYKEIGWNVNAPKQDQSDNSAYILQQRYHPALGRHSDGRIKSTQPIMHTAVSIFFQERADEFAGAQATGNAIMRLNNAAYHPLISKFVDYVRNGDVKYGLGRKTGGVKSLFKLIALEAKEQGRSIEQALDLAWVRSVNGDKSANDLDTWAKLPIAEYL